jgi:hypothetical protein
MRHPQILDHLNRVRRRARLAAVAWGAGWVVLTGVALVLAVVGLDYLLNLPPLPRLVIVASALTAWIASIWLYIAKPASSGVSLAAVAGTVERAFPILSDRLRSAVEFQTANVPGSEAMKALAVDEAAMLAANVDFSKVVTARPALMSISGAAGAVLLLSLLAGWLVPESLRAIAVERLLRPFAGAEWPKSVQIDVLGEPPRRVASGQRVDLKLRLVRGDRASVKSVVLYRYGDGPESQGVMTRNADGSYDFSLEAVGEAERDSTLRVSLKAGDDLRELPPITVVPRFAIRSLRMEVLPPAYLREVIGAEASSLDPLRGPMTVSAGSVLTLVAEFNRQLGEGESIALESADPSRSLAVVWEVEPGRTVARGKWEAAVDGRFRIRARDGDGFENSQRDEFELIVRPDQTPGVQIEQPRRNEERTPNSVVRLIGVAEDDHGIRDVELHVLRLSDRKMWEIPLLRAGVAAPGVSWTPAGGAGERVRFRAGWEWELSELSGADLKAGDVLEYWLVARDYFRAGDQVHEPAVSGRLRIHIITPEELTSRVLDDLRAVRQRLAEVRGLQVRTQQETATVQADLGEKPTDESSRATLERLGSQQATAASQVRQQLDRLQELQARLEENRSQAAEVAETTRDVMKLLDATTEGPMREAIKNLASGSDASREPVQRNEALAGAQRAQESAAEQLQQAMDRLGKVGSLQTAIDRVAQMLREQQELNRELRELSRQTRGRTADQLTPEQRARLAEIAQRQKKASEQTQRATSDLEKSAAESAQSDPGTSQAMKQAASTAQQQQVASKQQAASREASENQQDKASALQQQAELGLEMMLAELREAERRQLRELVRQLASIEEQLVLLVRRQAGHNLENLLHRGPAAIEAAGPDVVARLTGESERTAESPAPDPSRFASAQEQTERNTRSIASDAAKVAQASDASAQLVRAAGRMERAIVELRAGRHDSAYEPAQVEALEALREALSLVRDRKQEAEEEIAQQQRDAIRARFQKIRDQQFALNDRTDGLGRSRDAGKPMSREELMQLAALPEEQSAIAEEAQGIDADLAALESVVFVWSNKDIVRRMRDLAEKLGVPDVSKDVRDEQARVLERLDAMIRSLSIKPLRSRFAQDSSGASSAAGGAGSRPIPPEAELRMLKSLQEEVNNATRTANAAQPRPDDQVISAGEAQRQVRELFDQMIQKASEGRERLADEPPEDQLLPEEATAAEVDDDELNAELLGGNEQASQEASEVRRAGDRMARSRQRLTVRRDPGEVTQLIQRRIIEDLDRLIDQARSREAETRNSQPKSRGEQKQQAQPGSSQAQNQGSPQPAGSNAAQQSTAGPAGSEARPAQEIRESMAEWGGITPRQRQAVIEGASENVVERYRKIVDDYYRALATRSTERK